MNPLLELARFGQSYWLGDLSRTMIDSGELQRRVTQELQRAGIDVPQVTRHLLDDGIAKFVDSLNDILQTIGTKALTGRAAAGPAPSMTVSNSSHRRS